MGMIRSILQGFATELCMLPFPYRAGWLDNVWVVVAGFLIDCGLGEKREAFLTPALDRFCLIVRYHIE
jgi:hypothetical protein